MNRDEKVKNDIRKCKENIKFFKLSLVFACFISFLFGFSTTDLNEYIPRAILFNMVYFVIVIFFVSHNRNKIENIKEYHKL